ncbi:MAG: glycosyltransferase, partial [Nitrososphaera sp.]
MSIHSSILNYYGTHLGAGADGVNVGEFKTMFKLIGENSASRQSIFTLYNVKHVVIDKNFDRYPSFLNDQLSNEKYLVYYDHESYWVTGDPSYLYEILRNDASFVRSYEDSNFAIFTFTGITKPSMLSTVSTNTKNTVANPSFESGVVENWQTWPGNLVRINNNDGHVGNWSLAMQGLSDWWPNAHQLVPIEEGAIYQLKFAIKPFNMTDAHVKLLWYDQSETIRDDTALRTDYVRSYEMSLTQGEWNGLEKTYFPPAGARFVDIQLLGSRVRDPYSSTLTLYDDIGFSKISALDSSRGTSFASINPTHWVLNIDTNEATKVSFAQSYDPRWEARVYKDGFLVETVKPTKFVNVLNSFDITTVGSDLEVHILFMPQSPFEASFIPVAAVLSLSAGYLSYYQFTYLRRKLLQHGNMQSNDPTLQKPSVARKAMMDIDELQSFSAVDQPRMQGYQKGRVSIVIPTRNSSRTLESCLRSIREQTYTDLEVIVVDSNSSDDTIPLATSFGANIVALDGERTKAKNIGASRSSGEFLLFLDSDMVLESTVIEECVDLCSPDGNVAGVIIPERSVGTSYWVKVRDFERSLYQGSR